MSTRPPSPIGRLLRRQRTAAALSQEELADRAGLSVRAISDLERGVHQVPRLETVRLLADALALNEVDRGELVSAARPDVDVAPTAVSERAPPQATLPLSLTPLIGRERDAAVLCDLLTAGERRLVTLTGPGGVGKTRLALAAADTLASSFADGVVFVDLAPVRDPALLPAVIATSLGIREGEAQSLADQIAAFLHKRAMLLILDNFEQVLDAAPLVTEFLAASPALRVLVTSREPLRLSGEQVVPVGPLALPGADHFAGLDDVQRSAAVALFVDRAHAADPGFALDEENAAAIAAIVRRLDGLPLAIELAAARVRTLPPTALLPRLGPQTLRLLTGGPRDHPNRQRTIRDAIGWSYALLSPAEQRLFRTLSVFVGGFGLEAAAAVAGESAELEILEGLASLVDKSLVTRLNDSVGQPRFTMLETIREFGLEQLAASGDELRIREAHVAWVVNLSGQAEAELLGREQVWWLKELDGELPNLRAALGWLKQSGDAAMGLRVAGALEWFWFIRGHLREGRAWLEDALADGVDVPPSLRVRALIATRLLALGQHDYPAALAFAEASLAIAERVGDTRTIAAAQFALGIVLQMQGDYELSVVRLEEALPHFRQSEDRVWVAFALTQLGESVFGLPDLDRAAALHEEALSVLRQSGGPWTTALTLQCLGSVVLEQGNIVRAEQLLSESLTLAFDIDDRWFVGDTLALLAITAERQGQFQRAARLIGTVDAVQESIHAPLMFIPAQAARYAKSSDTARRQLGDEAFAAARAVGRAMSLAEASGEVLFEGTHDQRDCVAHDIPQNRHGGN
jgi:predicted ATPase/DNA-binding XRE family transcriptional regulator